MGIFCTKELPREQESVQQGHMGLLGSSKALVISGATRCVDSDPPSFASTAHPSSLSGEKGGGWVARDWTERQTGDEESQ